MLSDPASGRVITAVVSALPGRPATAEAAGRFFADRLGREQVLFDRAHDRGELADDAYLERLVDTVLTGVAR
nr:TetR/AcrR family transcriptional regulator C-terminal ligand-binding domain-containing protein [Amycolatopsis niigatensis]